MAIIAIRRVVRATEIPIDEWKDNAVGVCRGISRKVFASQVVVGTLRMPDGSSKRHAWLLCPGQVIIDPTLWTLTNKSPEIVTIPLDDPTAQHYSAYPDGLMPVPLTAPPPTPHGKRIMLSGCSDGLDRRLKGMCKFNVSLTINTLSWLCDVPTSRLAPYHQEFYEIVVSTGYGFMLPDDVISALPPNIQQLC